MKSFSLSSALLLAVASASAASALELESLPQVNPHPDWALSLGAIAVIAGVVGVIMLARRMAAKAKRNR